MSTINLGRVTGKSAYEIAVANGFSGSESQWLASLKGEKGADGVITSAEGINVVKDLSGTIADDTDSLVNVAGAKAVKDALNELTKEIGTIRGYFCVTPIIGDVNGSGNIISGNTRAVAVVNVEDVDLLSIKTINSLSFNIRGNNSGLGSAFTVWGGNVWHTEELDLTNFPYKFMLIMINNNNAEITENLLKNCVEIKTSSDIGDINEKIGDMFENITINESVHPEFVDGYWSSSGTTPASSTGYYCIKELIAVSAETTIKLYNWTFGAADTAAAYLYDANKNPIGSRLNVEDFSLANGVYSYAVENDSAAYIGIDHKYSPSADAYYVLSGVAKSFNMYYMPLLATKEYVKNAVADKPIKDVDLIMFMGQSNMAGRGVVNTSHPETAPTILSGAGYEFRAISDPTKLYTIVEPFGRNENVSGAINDDTSKTGSMVTAFVNAYSKKTGTPVIAVSASEGGTKIELWQPNTARLNDAISRLSSAVTYLTNNGYTIRHKYMVWCQGESNGDINTSADNYKTMFNAMAQEMFAQGIEKCFVVRIGEYNGGASVDYSTIMLAQNDICKDSDNYILVSTAFASFKAKGLMKDAYHYYQQAYNIVGTQAGANAAEYVLYKKSPIMYDPKNDNLYYSKYSY